MYHSWEMALKPYIKWKETYDFMKNQITGNQAGIKTIQKKEKKRVTLWQIRWQMTDDTWSAINTDLFFHAKQIQLLERLESPNYSDLKDV